MTVLITVLVVWLSDNKYGYKYGYKNFCNKYGYKYSYKKLLSLQGGGISGTQVRLQEFLQQVRLQVQVWTWFDIVLFNMRVIVAFSIVV